MSWYDDDKFRREGENAARQGRRRYDNPYDEFESGDGLRNRHELWDEGHRHEERRQEERDEEAKAEERRAAQRREEVRMEREREREEYEQYLREQEQDAPDEPDPKDAP